MPTTSTATSLAKRFGTALKNALSPPPAPPPPSAEEFPSLTKNMKSNPIYIALTDTGLTQGGKTDVIREYVRTASRGKHDFEKMVICLGDDCEALESEWRSDNIDLLAESSSLHAMTPGDFKGKSPEELSAIAGEKMPEVDKFIERFEQTNAIMTGFIDRCEQLADYYDILASAAPEIKTAGTSIQAMSGTLRQRAKDNSGILDANLKREKRLKDLRVALVDIQGNINKNVLCEDFAKHIEKSGMAMQRSVTAPKRARFAGKQTGGQGQSR